MKYYKRSFKEVVWGMSFVNLTMLLASIEPIGETPKKEDSDDTEEEIGTADAKDLFGL